MVVYTSTGQPAVYEEMSVTLFVSGLLMVMAREKIAIKPYMLQHMQELMEDAESYGWELIRAYHAIWLQQLEQGRVSWPDEEKKMKYHRALVWHHVMATAKPISAPPRQNHQQPQPGPGKAQRRGATFSQPSPKELVCSRTP